MSRSTHGIPRPYRTVSSDGNTWTWHIQGIGRLSFVDVTHTRGEWLASTHARLWYSFRRVGKRRPLFMGHLDVPAHTAIDALKVALTALHFVCLRRGDTDAEYFSEYTAAQLEWCESSECEAAQLAVDDLKAQLETA
jgi:hypothetical protein